MGVKKYSDIFISMVYGSMIMGMLAFLFKSSSRTLFRNQNIRIDGAERRLRRAKRFDVHRTLLFGQIGRHNGIWDQKNFGISRGFDCSQLQRT